ncbi:hypothetical protein ACS5PK_21575 [Roseateles sp. DB2]|uniref:hypothetical protein n=1 Tax=Roseateles sp. DB2 TaxID=3453717 RepID=UPI003EEAB702
MDAKEINDLLASLRSSLGTPSLVDRLKAVIDWETNESRRWKELEACSGIAANSWQQMWRGRQRPTAEMIEAVAQEWPAYAFWLVTGLTDTAAGHTAPQNQSLWPSPGVSDGLEGGITWKPLIELRRLVAHADEADDWGSVEPQIIDLLTTISQRSLVERVLRRVLAEEASPPAAKRAAKASQSAKAKESTTTRKQRGPEES